MDGRLQSCTLDLVSCGAFGAPGAAAPGRGQAAPTHLCQLQSFSSRASLAREAFHEVKKGSRVNSKVIPADQHSHLAA